MTAERLLERVQTADWKTEKHVPVIECPAEVKAGEVFTVKIMVGKEIGHPNTTEHHIRWIGVFFQPEGEKFTYHVGTFEFAAHGDSTEGANKGPVFTVPDCAFSLKISKSETLHALAMCNIHGLWESAKKLRRAPQIEMESRTMTTW